MAMGEHDEAERALLHAFDSRETRKSSKTNSLPCLAILGSRENSL